MIRSLSYLEPVTVTEETVKWALLAVQILMICEPCLKWLRDERRGFTNEYYDRLSRMCVKYDNTTEPLFKNIWLFLCNVLNTLLKDLDVIDQDSLMVILMILSEHCPSEESVSIITEFIKGKILDVKKDYNEYMDEALFYYSLCLQFVSVHHTKVAEEAIEILQSTISTLDIGPHLVKELELVIERINLALGNKQIHTSIRMPNCPSSICKKILESYRNKRPIFSENDLLMKIV